jgi:hypothetical protein
VPAGAALCGSCVAKKLAEWEEAERERRRKEDEKKK